nr:PucR family transcriptional regulator [Cryobacterium sp. BB307]
MQWHRCTAGFSRLCETDTVPTVSEIVALRALALSAVTLPHPDAAVRWVATSELPDPSPYLEGGELLLTTGLVDRDAAGWGEFVRVVLEAGVVAVGFGVGVRHPELPVALAAAAARDGLNLFVVPQPTPFIAVSKAVADSLADAERDEDRRSLAHQQELTRAAVVGSAELVDALGRIVGGSAAVIGQEGDALFGFAGLGDRARPLIERMQRGDRRSAFAEIGAAGRMLVQPVELHGRTDAYLVIESPDALNPAQRTAVSTALALLTLERDRARVERDAERRIRAGAVSLLLQGDAVAAEAVLGALPWASARVVRARGAAVGEILATLEHLGAIATVTPDDELIVISPDEPELPGLLVGVGPVQPLAALGVSDSAARDALAAASPGRPVVRWEELAGEGVDALLSSESLTSYTAMLLGPVLARPDAGELVAALRSFLKHNGQVGPAAAELGVHRNTVRNRLALAEDLLGRSLQDPQARADLWIALKHVTAG